jgi:subtilisin-like proprotein convertase family protein
MNIHTAISAAALLACAPAFAAGNCGSTPIAIPDDSSIGISVPISIELPGELVESVRIDLDLLHPWVGDLVIQLESPDGTIVTLLDRPGIPSVGFPGPFGCGGGNILASFEDGSPQAAETMCSTSADPVISGLVGPSDALSVLHGESASGLWQLHVSDLSLYDTGVLDSVCIELTTTLACAADMNRDGVLDIFDVFAYLDFYAAQDPLADFTDDGVWDIFDVFAFLDAFEIGCP